MHPTVARPRPRPPAAGATLLELLVLLVVASVLAAIAYPNYRDWIADTRLRNQAEALAATLTRARSAAMRSGVRVTVCKSADRQTCAQDGGWDQGWLVFVDEDRDGAREPDEAALHVESRSSPEVTILGNQPLADYVSYTSLGHPRLVNGGLQMGTFVACSPGRNAIRVVLAHSGRVRLARSADPCP